MNGGIFDTFTEIVFTTVHGRIDWFNRQWYEYTGQHDPQRAAEIGDSMFAQALRPEDRQPTRLALLDEMARGAPFSLELRLQRADGSRRWFRVHLSPLQADSGDFDDRWISIC